MFFDFLSFLDLFSCSIHLFTPFEFVWSFFKLKKQIKKCYFISLSTFLVFDFLFSSFFAMLRWCALTEKSKKWQKRTEKTKRPNSRLWMVLIPFKKTQTTQEIEFACLKQVATRKTSDFWFCLHFRFTFSFASFFTLKSVNLNVLYRLFALDLLFALMRTSITLLLSSNRLTKKHTNHQTLRKAIWLLFFFFFFLTFYCFLLQKFKANLFKPKTK